MVTASLPVPQDSYPNEADGVVDGARKEGGRVVALPPKPSVSADDAAAALEATDAAPPRPRKAPVRKATAAKRPVNATPKRPARPAGTSSAELVDGPLTTPAKAPGPPPPLPETVSESEAAPSEPEAAAAPEAKPLTKPRAKPKAPRRPKTAPKNELKDEPKVEPGSPIALDEPASDARVLPAQSEDVDQAGAAEPIVVAEPLVVAETEAATDVASDAPLATMFAAESESSSEPAHPALLVRGISKSFGDTRAVDGIDLTVPAGTFYGLVGPNGAGKTTTLSMITGLLRPDRGSISVNGVDAASDPRAAKRIMGVLPDRLRTFDRLTGRQLLYYYGVLRKLPSAVVERRTNDLARAFDLTDALGRVVSDYSAGMVKKVMLAGAMIHSPRVLVLDEPFEAVDPVSSAIILDILGAYVAHGGTVILSSHGMDLVERVCSRVAVIVAGQVLAEGTIEEVRGELTLEQRFIELAGGLSDVEGLEWLHTFSD